MKNKIHSILNIKNVNKAKIFSESFKTTLIYEYIFIVKNGYAFKISSYLKLKFILKMI